jgi:hypothetical protein
MKKAQAYKYAKCPKCKRKISLSSDGTFHTHGPGVDTFMCPGSRTKPVKSKKK